ncbi:MAG: hypothetical protein AAGA42_21845 [Actinomycetota bacterium]
MGSRKRVGRALSALVVGAIAVAGVGTTGADAPPKQPVSDLTVDAEVASDAYLVGNVTAINLSPAGGFVSVFGGDFTGTSTVNTTGSDVLPNAFVADPGADGEIGVRIGGTSQRHVIVDSVAELRKNPNTTIFASPQRVKDTRRDGSTVTAGGTITVDIGTRYAGQFALINLTVDRNDGAGFQATFPCTEGYQGTSSINVKGGGGAQAILNLVRVDENGQICIRSQRAAVGTIVDFLGVIDSDAESFERIIDTRRDGGTLQPGREVAVRVGPPNSVFIGTVVSTNPSNRGWVAAYTNAGGYNGTSTVNSDGVNSVANLVILQTDASGNIHLQSKPNPSGLRTDVVIDGTIVSELNPYLRADAKRLRDTRDDTPVRPTPSGPITVAEATIIANEFIAAANAGDEATIDELVTPSAFDFGVKDLLFDRAPHSLDSCFQVAGAVNCNLNAATVFFSLVFEPTGNKIGLVSFAFDLGL